LEDCIYRLDRRHSGVFGIHFAYGNESNAVEDGNGRGGSLKKKSNSEVFEETWWQEEEHGDRNSLQGETFIAS
jgi:hypothetical protein